MEEQKNNAAAANTQLTSQNATAIRRAGENITTQVLERVAAKQKAGELVLPKGYEAGNALNSAWLYLQTIETKTHQKAIDVCTKNSIANALLEMVIKGEHCGTHCYFIPCGNSLEFWERYTGKLMRARRDTNIKDVHAQVIYEGDNFVYTVDENGDYQLVKHETSIDNMDITKIKGAYAVVVNKDNTTRHLEIMTMDMIRKAWGQGAARGNSGAHTNFTDQMCKKTIIARACKVALDSTSDGEEEDGSYMVPPTASQERDIANGQNPGDGTDTRRLHRDSFEEGVEYEEVDSETDNAGHENEQPDVHPAEQAAQAAQQPAPAKGHKKVRECPI
jgi:recombination protein RecT